MKMKLFSVRQLSQILISTSSALALFAALGAHADTPNSNSAPARGIVGTGTLGIVGTGSPASTQGIVGTGSPASTQGIVGTGTLGIVGTGTLGIVGTGVLENVASRTSSRDPVEAFADWSSAVSSDRQSRLAVYGPVDAVSDSSVMILGQEFPIDDTRLLQQLMVSDTAAVFLRGRGKNSQAYRVVKVLEEFVQGASLVYVTGIISTKQRSDGSFKVGKLEVNIGEAGTDSKAYQLKKGKRITIIGRKFGSEMSADRIIY